MNLRFKFLVPVVLTLVLLTSCGEISREVEQKLNELRGKAESLDSLVNKEVDKVMELDSLINYESLKIKELDSLVGRSAATIDSVLKSLKEKARK